MPKAGSQPLTHGQEPDEPCARPRPHMPRRILLPAPGRASRVRRIRIVRNLRVLEAARQPAPLSPVRSRRSL